MSAAHGMRSAESGAAKTLVCFALEEEARAFRKLGAKSAEVAILITGMGRKNAEQSVREFLAGNSPRQIFTAGFAGGLNPELKIGDVLFATDNSGLAASLTNAGARPVKFFCAPRIATTTAEKSELWRTTGADAVEMESEFIQAISRARDIPCATVRVISDPAQDELPLDFNQLANADLSLNYGKLAFALAKSPGKIPALLRLQKNSQLAAERLATTLAKVCGVN